MVKVVYQEEQLPVQYFWNRDFLRQLSCCQASHLILVLALELVLVSEHRFNKF